MKNLLLVMSLLTLSLGAFADEMDELSIPSGMIVEMHKDSGEASLYQANNINLRGVNSPEAAKAALQKIIKEGNQVEGFSIVEEADEMDETTSTRSWYWYTWGNYTTWNQWGNFHYNYFSYYNTAYRWAYTWNYGYYNYYFYW